MPVKTIQWRRNAVRIIDQTQLPAQLVYLDCRDVKTVWHAIKILQVRGAPAIGIAAAYGVVLGAQRFRGRDVRAFLKHVSKTCRYLSTSRPTAVNLFYALKRMEAAAQANADQQVKQIQEALKKEADQIMAEDQKVCRDMGRQGAPLIKTGMRVLTICNAGALATADYGTALGVMYSAQEAGRKFQVYACETRPLLQGARLTAWELKKSRIDTTLICDNMAATLMQQGKVDIIFTGADRIAGNGDTANKIGTYMLAVLAKHHKVPFYVVAPVSTFDPDIKTGAGIPIEERDPSEVKQFAGKATAPPNVKVYNPAFDVTPHKLISGIVTETGVLKPPFRSAITKMFRQMR